MQFTDEEWTKKVEEFQARHFGRRYRGASLSKADVYSHTVNQGIQRYVEGHKSDPGKALFLVLMGPPGTGKTYLASALCEWIHGKFNTFRVWKEQALYEHLREAIASNHDFTNALRYASDDEMVVLDDLGSNSVNEWRKDVIFNFIDMRYENYRNTIITTNLTQKEIGEKYGERTRSRLFGYETIVADFFGDTDLRTVGL